MIEVEHLVKSYGQARAVNDISFKVEKGEILGFLGPNGAGKTTTMRVLTGYLPATGGTARIAGFDVFEQSMEVRKRIGYLPETPPLYPEMSVTDYLTFVARIKGLATAEIPNRVADAMRMATLTERKDELIKRLSRGFKQRVGIAQAIVHNPDVIILDEPTVGLDPNQIKEVRGLIKNLAGQHTIILSTHILPEVEMTCDRVVIINKGSIAAIDTTRNLTKQLKGGERVRLQVKGPAKNLRDSIAEIEGVRNVEVNSGDDNLVIADIESESGADLRPQIASRVVSGGFDLLELRAVNLSLEDIFMQLTTEEKADAKVAGNADAKADETVEAGADEEVDDKIEEKVEEKVEEKAAP
ncbi:MAG: ABC transporter ATP-binding protein [Acidobacteria bacterium]|nr:ABC transporter ATP-binding protein [Acidobacteriota bacterium]